MPNKIKATVESMTARGIDAVTEDEFADLFENANVGLHWVGPDGIVLRVNRAELELLGYSREEYVGRHVSEFHADPKVAANILHRLNAGEQLQKYPARLRCKDGSVKDVLINSSVYRLSGRFIHTRCFTLDVTGIEQYHSTQRLLASIVSSSDDAIISKTLDGRITSWNNSAERLFGYSAAEAIGKPITLIIPPDRLDEERTILERLRRGEKIEHYETVRATKTGDAIEISLTISPLMDREGRIVGASKVARDISARKRAEAAAQAAQQSLAEGDRRKDHFLAMLAHELRNPLAPLRNSLEMMKRAPDNAAVFETAKTMMDRQLAHVERLVDDLLDMARINQDRLLLRKQQVDLVAVIHQVVEGIRPSAEASMQQLDVTLPAEPIYLDADPVRIAQIFANLLSNAVKYTPRGGRISLTAWLQGPSVTVSVKDTGLGIPGDMLDGIFDMFAQVKRPGEQPQSGLGIGLSLARRLILMHGGRVQALSNGPDSGSEFLVSLPVSVRMFEAQARARPAANSPHARRRILIVDDNLDAAESLAILMKLEGHDVRMAFDGLEAVKAAEAYLPHIVFLDLGLPKLRGSEAASRIRQQPWGKDMLIVAVTGWGQDKDRRKSREVGFDHHLVKPAKLEDLIRIIDALPA
ncbi:MAG TPA: PAS domain S-box protein [Burkholderiales bacterium]